MNTTIAQPIGSIEADVTKMCVYYSISDQWCLIMLRLLVSCYEYVYIAILCFSIDCV